jgi:hypothetical protein
MIHEVRCPYNETGKDHSDEAKRVSDTYRLHRLADPIGSIGHFFAVSLADGRSDNVLYDTRRECVTHQHHNESYYFYIQIRPCDMNACQAESALSGARKVARTPGMQLTDRDHRAGGRSLIPRVTEEDQRQMLRSLLSGGKLPQSNIRLP